MHERREPVDEIRLKPIGTVRTRRTATTDKDWGALSSVIEVLPEFAAGLAGLEQFSHVLVLFYMHQDDGGEAPALTRRPRGRADMPLLGVFAQRGRMRPNRVGITPAEIVSVEPGRLTVRGLDAIDGTPVFDLKPYVPVFDQREARVPEWMDRLMAGYF
jgi:tRNA-Thr(GGU) m(6)t(6)A37 methyltransferase TsaA